MSNLKVQKLPSVKRLPNYLRELRRLRDLGQLTVSTTQISNALAVEPIVVRKDFEMTGAVGGPRVGYRLETLIEKIESFLGWNNTTDAFLIGAGSLGTALLGYRGFSEYGLNIVAAFDVDPEKIGMTIHEKPVLSTQKFTSLASRLQVKIAILCVPSGQAQDLAEMAVEAGISAIWNFSNTRLNVPGHVVIQQANLAGDLAVLSVKVAEKLKVRRKSNEK